MHHRAKVSSIAALLLLATPVLAADTGPFATTASVQVQGDKGNLPLDKNAQVAFMFLVGIIQEEQTCTIHLNHPCTLDQIVSGVAMAPPWNVPGLKYDPRKADPNYTYTLVVEPNAWSLSVTPKKAGRYGFFKEDNFVGTVHYNMHGAATAQDPATMGYGITGDSFVKS